MMHNCNSNDSNNPGYNLNDVVSMYVVFGRPGAGKTTVADMAVNEYLTYGTKQRRRRQQQRQHAGAVPDCLGLDLDVCVTDKMRDNFSIGIYPTLQERIEFAEKACDYVQRSIEEKLTTVDTDNTKEEGIINLVSIVSFSFVNTDLRDVFRKRFPKAQWILIDTNEEEATNRIHQRRGHFYTGEKQQQQTVVGVEENGRPSSSSSSSSSNVVVEDKDNSEWKFAPVDFSHTILDGNDPVEINSQRVMEQILEAIQVAR
jgi:hypothetical protein